MFIAFKGYQPSGCHHKFVGWSNSIVSMSWVGLSKDNRHSTTSETRGDMTTNKKYHDDITISIIIRGVIWDLIINVSLKFKH